MQGKYYQIQKIINNTEESVIDHFIVCKRHVINLTIDEAGKYSLTKYTNKTGSTKCNKESDHRTLILEIDYRWDSKKDKINDRIEVFNYKNNEDFIKFKALTSENIEPIQTLKFYL